MAEPSVSINEMAGRLAKAEVYQSIQFAIAETLVGTATIHDAAPRILRTLGTSLGWQLVNLWLVDKRDSCLRLARTWQAPSSDIRNFVEVSQTAQFCQGESLPGRVYVSGTPLWIADFAAQAFVRSAAAAQDGIKSAIGFPIFSDLECVGVIELFSQHVKSDIDTDTLDVLVNVGYRIGQSFKRRELEKRLRDADARYKVLIDSSMSGMIVANHMGVITEWNAAAEALFGYKKAEIIGTNLLNLMPVRYRAAHIAALEKIQKSDNTLGSRVIGRISEVFGLRKDGTEIPITVSLSTWNTTGERFFGAIILQRDRSEPEQVNNDPSSHEGR